mgnify:CR=1 FL=1
MRLKPETRIMGIDDGSFNKDDDETIIIGVIFRGGYWIDGLVSTYIKIDGMDATDNLIEMITGCKYKDLRIIMLSGVTFGGFNVVDIERLSKETGLPVVVVIERKPDLEDIVNAVKNVHGQEERIRCMERAGEVYMGENGIYFQVHGISEDLARKVIRKTSTHSNIPEPLRVSHIIASGISRGEASKR